MTASDDAVVRRQIVVDLPIEQAFATFVERFGDFKPPEHNLLGADIIRDTVRADGPVATSTTEPQMGGSADGPVSSRTSHPIRLSSAGTSIPSGSSRPTRTTPARSKSGLSRRHRTGRALELEHRHLDRHGPGWESLRGAIDSDGGWPLYMARYADLVAEDR